METLSVNNCNAEKKSSIKMHKMKEYIRLHGGGLSSFLVQVIPELLKNETTISNLLSFTLHALT